MLVCPVVEEDASTWSVYLPEGDWFDLWTHEHITGNQHVQVAASLDRIPVFVRGGAAIPAVWGANQQFGDHVLLSSSPNDTVSYG